MFEENIEIKYISIDWLNKTTAREIHESIHPLTIEKTSEYRFEIEALTYTRIEDNRTAQIAFNISSELTKTVPYFINANGVKEELIKIHDTETGKDWWIENGEWSKSRKSRDSLIFRHVGETTLYFESKIELRIKIRALSFTFDQIQLYLDDFRNGLWDLILKEDSYVFGEAKEQTMKIASPELLKLIGHFCKSGEAVIENPKKELKEIQALKDYKEIRPVPRTFMEIASKGLRKELTSRDYEESYDVAENRYVHYLLYNISVLVKNLRKSLSRINQSGQNALEINQGQIEAFSSSMTVDKEIFMWEMKDLEKRLQEKRMSLADSIQKFNPVSIYNPQRVNIRFGVKSNPKDDRYEQYAISFNVSPNNENNFNELMIMPALFKDSINVHDVYDLDADVHISVIQADDGMRFRPFLKRKVLRIHKMELLQSDFHRKLTEKQEEFQGLEYRNWVRELTGDEIQQQNYEKTALQQKNKLLQSMVVANTELMEELSQLDIRLAKLLRRFKEKRVSFQNLFPGSMTFVQNPSYRSNHSVYKKIFETSGINNTLFQTLLDYEKIGLLDIPTLYERWCLIQIIKVLIDRFHFIAEKNWKTKLLDQIKAKQYNSIVTFKHNELDWSITLISEKVLANNKRPDFVLELYSKSEGQHLRTLVMDSKFYEDINAPQHGGIGKIIQDLYVKKDYAENGQNYVYILHPTEHAVPLRRTPQTWSVNTYYGENRMFKWAEGEYPDHRYGAICMNPVKSFVSYLDDLQRLIGIFLEYKSGLENDNKIICLVCGGTNCHKEVLTTRSGHEKYNYTCNDCHHFFVNNYCFNCHTRLWKHGSYWTYHSTFATQPYNIKCPHCGSIL